LGVGVAVGLGVGVAVGLGVGVAVGLGVGVAVGLGVGVAVGLGVGVGGRAGSWCSGRARGRCRSCSFEGRNRHINSWGSTGGLEGPAKGYRRSIRVIVVAIPIIIDQVIPIHFPSLVGGIERLSDRSVDASFQCTKRRKDQPVSSTRSYRT
jgi:hypothetical protein